MDEHLRRPKQFLSEEEALEILKNGSYGVLALRMGEGTYASPTNYVLVGKTLYFHCAPIGDKPEAVADTPKGSFCVVEKDRIVQSIFESDYKSAIAFGPLYFVENLEEKAKALDCLAEKYAPQTKGRIEEIEKALHYICIFKLVIEKATAKVASEEIRNTQK